MTSGSEHVNSAGVDNQPKRLIVYWGAEEEADYQTPAEARWDDGSPATLDDYRKNQSATRTSQLTDKGHATVFFLDVTSVTRYDSEKGHWVLKASNGDVFELLERDPNASDKTLIDEISNNEAIYRTTIVHSRES